MAKVIHSMIRVLEEKRSVEFYQKALGLVQQRRVDFDDFTLVYLSNDESPVELELTINKDQTEPYETGTGYGHLAFSVDNLEAEHKKITQLGYSPEDIVDFKHNGKTMAKFFFMKDPDGYSIEVLQRSGEYT